VNVPPPPSLLLLLLLPLPPLLLLPRSHNALVVGGHLFRAVSLASTPCPRPPHCPSPIPFKTKAC
jgi:hypothetical protein